jgi:hypothetical protein
MLGVCGAAAIATNKNLTSCPNHLAHESCGGNEHFTRVLKEILLDAERIIYLMRNEI